MSNEAWLAVAFTLTIGGIGGYIASLLSRRKAALRRLRELHGKGH